MKPSEWESNKNSKKENDIEILRSYILTCPNLTPESQAISVALAALDDGLSPHKQKNGYHLTSHTSKNKQTSHHKRRGSYHGGGRVSILHILRILCIDGPLAALFTSYILLVFIHNVRDEFLQPQLELMEWNASRRSEELTYYHRFCNENDLTTRTVDDLMIRDYFTLQDCVDHQMIHGMSIYPNILKDNTSDILRQYILERNSQLTSKDAIGVLSNQNRWSFGIDVQDHPIIPIVLEEISSHIVFRPAVERIVGPNPAIIEFTAITSAYGAEDQIWHTDVLSSGSAARYAKSFIPSYSFFISLQDITAEMGATTVCPGTYMCESHDNSFCQDHCFQASGNNSVWKKGYGILMNQQSYHRGAAHVDSNGPHRVLFIVTFTHRPTARAESRQIGQGGSYSMKWDNWGHCLSDIADSVRTITPPWSYLRALGLYKPPKRDWGWDYISMISMRIANHDTGYTFDKLRTFARNNPLGLPSFFLPVSITDDMTWSGYFLYVIVSIKRFLFNLYCFVISLYFMIVLGIALAIAQVYMDIDSNIRFLDSLRQVGLFLYFPFRRILIANGSILFIFYLIWAKLKTSFWAKDIHNKHLYTSAFSKQHISPFLINRSTMHVLRDDILVSTRSISQNFASYDNFMDYHPGNRELSHELDSVSSDILQYPSNILNHYIGNVIETLLRQRRLFSIQNSNGDWVEMSSDERKWYIMSILSKSNQILYKVDNEANYLLSQSFYSPAFSRTMSMYTRCTIYALLELIPTTMGETLLSMNKFYNIQSTTHEIFHGRKHTYQTSTSSSNKQSRWKYRTSLSPLRATVMNRILVRSTCKPDATKIGHIIRFKVGDIVDARYRGKGNEVCTSITLGNIYNHVMFFIIFFRLHLSGIEES